ncbi:MAG: hypothetical protein AAF587_07990 [Bacteroidota bacterium]
MPKRSFLSASPIGAILSFCSSWGYYSLAEISSSFSWILLFAVASTHFVLLYLFASRFQRTPLGEGLRGAIIGLNAGLNTVLLYQLSGSWIVAGILGGLVFLSAFLFISRHSWYHTVLGYSNWLLPMSWPVSYIGLLIYLVNLLVAPIGYMHPLLRALRVRLYIDLSTSTFTMYGGLIRPFKGFSGLNMGNFIFINPGWEHLLRHEIGHLFSLAAMGSVFHYIGGIDENYLQQNYWEAYAEYLAESYNSPSASGMSMWR